MNNAQVRANIAAALSTVEGVKGYARRPKSPKAGDGWPLWRGSERADGFLFTQTFAVVIALSGDVVAADDFADAHGDELADALEPVLFVESFAPAVTATDAGDMNALMITGRVE